MSNILTSILAIVLALAVAYGLHITWSAICHARRARQWGCEPAFIRPYRLPLGYDIFKRYIDAANENDLQNDDMILFRELGLKATWNQQVLGTWHHVTSDPKNIQAMLATQFNDFELGPIRRATFKPLLGDGIFTSDGKEWEHSRAMLRPQFSRKQVSNLDLEETHVQNLFEQIPCQADSWTHEVDLGPLFFNLTLDSATEFLFGESVNSQKNRKETNLEQANSSEKMKGLDWRSFGKRFDEANAAVLTRMRLYDFYWLYNPKSFQDDCRNVHRCVDYFVNRALNAKTPQSEHNEYVFSHELAQVTKDPITLRSQLLNILLAGRDTTAGLLGFTCYFLARHPEIYDRLRRTILSHFGTGNESITFESLKSCTYLQHVMAEVLRIEPIVPENARRSAKNTTLPRGGGPDGQSPVYIRAGEEVMYNVRIMHRRKDIWGEDAEEFNPDRWYGLKAGWEYLPFNGGPRICIGQQFALTEAGYVIVRMLQRFDKIENMDQQPAKHRFTQTTAPLNVLVRLHEAEL